MRSSVVFGPPQNVVTIGEPNLPPSELEQGAIPDAPETSTQEGRRSPLGALIGPAVLRSFAGDADGLRAGGVDRQPVIAIINTWSDLQSCHSHFKQHADDGILMAGSFPVELPAPSVAESFSQADHPRRIDTA